MQQKDYISLEGVFEMDQSKIFFGLMLFKIWPLFNHLQKEKSQGFFATFLLLMDFTEDLETIIISPLFQSNTVNFF